MCGVGRGWHLWFNSEQEHDSSETWEGGGSRGRTIAGNLELTCQYPLNELRSKQPYVVLGNQILLLLWQPYDDVIR